MVYKAEDYTHPETADHYGSESSIGAFLPPVVRIDMAEIPAVVDELRVTDRIDLGDAVMRIAMMHELVVDGTDEPPQPVVLDGEPARQIHSAAVEAKLPDASLCDEPVELFTHRAVIGLHSGRIITRVEFTVARAA